MRKHAIATVLALTLSGGLAACGSGSSSSDGGPMSQASGVMSDVAKSGATMAQSVGLMGEDAKFLTTAIQSGIAEVELGRLARDRTDDREVRRFAQTMIDDHTNANRQLEALARAQELTVPTEMDSEHQTLHQQLSALRGSSFDREYMRGQIQDHETAVALFTEQAATETDPVAQTAAKILPKLREHLAMAREIGQSLEPARVSSAD
jgi:putative membrane protein